MYACADHIAHLQLRGESLKLLLTSQLLVVRSKENRNLPLAVQQQQQISIKVKQQGLAYIAHSILTSIISCYKE